MRGVLLLSNDRWGLAPVNVKSMSTPKHLRVIASLRDLGPESRRQAGAGRLHGLGLRLQRLLGLAPDRTRYADGADDPARKIRGRNRDAAHFEIELTLVVRDTRAPDLRELAQQGRSLGDRILGRRLELDALQKSFELVVAQRRQDHLAERRAMRGPHHAYPVCQLEGARPAHCTALTTTVSPMRTAKWLLSPVCR